MAAEAWRLLLDYFLANRDRQLKVAADFGLTLGEMRALLSLDSQAAQPMGMLAGRWKCDASNVTWLVDRLEDRGLAERRALPGDRRVKSVGVTPLGEKTRAELLARIYQPPDELAALSHTDLTALLSVLQKLASAPKGE